MTTIPYVFNEVVPLNFSGSEFNELGPSNGLSMPNTDNVLELASHFCDAICDWCV